MTNQQYHGDVSRVSKSGLDLVNKAPAKYYAKYLDPNRPITNKQPSDALIFGSALHKYVFERQDFASEFVVSAEFKGEGSRQRKNEFMELNEGKQAVSMEDYSKIQDMYDSLMRHSIVRELLTSTGVAEQTIHWTDPLTNVPCKCRPDWMCDYIVDLKSTEDASEDGFKFSAKKYRYYVQDAFYIDGARAAGFNPKGFIFIAIEKEYPYLVNLHVYGEDEREFGRETYQQDLLTYQECHAKNEWIGYGEDVKNLKIPGFSY